MMSKEHFEAGNLYLATFLLYKGFEIRGIAGCGRNKRLLFDNSTSVHKARDEFYNDSKKRHLFDCYRRAKDYLFQNGV